MEYLQYKIRCVVAKVDGSFKPYYKWNTFNTSVIIAPNPYGNIVLNLIINGIPSILHLQRPILLNL